MEKDKIAQAITSVFISPNVSDSNFEPANVVDALAQIADGLQAVAEAIRYAADKNDKDAETIRET